MGFSDIVKRVAAIRAMKPAEIARAAGYTPQHISDLLSGDRRWNETTINKVCEVLEIKIRFEYEEPPVTDTKI